MLISSLIIDKTVEAARVASLQIMRVYAEDFEVIKKQDGSPVTKADQLSSKSITEILSIFGYPILSEEGDLPLYSVRKNWTTYWLIDPLDGTKEFVKKNDEFCINIALIHNNQPIYGLICSPVTGHTVYAASDLGLWQGNFHNPSSFEKHPIIELDKTPLVRLVGSRSHGALESEIPTLDLKNKVISFHQKGSALKFIDLALGEADVYYRKGPTMEWDTAAGHVLLQVMKGDIVNTQGKTLVYNKENLLNPDFIAKTRIFTLV
ncbi:MAG: 3'(2'),5'-bisphosphate nucleotidase CysQ [Bacteroidetes bacterium]|nr:3'(2'),5'-bisphosphate nucleotidase CysQ [Bacteroidota bacterium]